jgi:hypothetical protein
VNSHNYLKITTSLRIQSHKVHLIEHTESFQTREFFSFFDIPMGIFIIRPKSLTLLGTIVTVAVKILE